MFARLIGCFTLPAAKAADPTSDLMMLLAGDAGHRCGEMMTTRPFATVRSENNHEIAVMICGAEIWSKALADADAVGHEAERLWQLFCA